MRGWSLLIAFLPACTGGGSGAARCLDPQTLATLDEHAGKIRAAAAFLAGHPGATEADGFFLFPALSVERGSVFAGPLVMACSGPLVYDEYCEADGVCSQIECTGQGAGWIMHFRLHDPLDGYTTATVDIAWANGDDGITFEIASEATGWSMTGSGRMDVDTMTLDETYPEVDDAGDTRLQMMETAAGDHQGSITLDGQLVASPDATTGSFTADPSCDG